MTRGGAAHGTRSSDAQAQTHWLAAKVRVLEGRLASLEARTGDKDVELTDEQESRQWLKASLGIPEAADTEVFQLCDDDASTVAEEEAPVIDHAADEALSYLVDRAVHDLVGVIKGKESFLKDLCDNETAVLEAGSDDVNFDLAWSACWDDECIEVDPLSLKPFEQVATALSDFEKVAMRFVSVPLEFSLGPGSELKDDVDQDLHGLAGFYSLREVEGQDCNPVWQDDRGWTLSVLADYYVFDCEGIVQDADEGLLRRHHGAAGKPFLEPGDWEMFNPFSEEWFSVEVAVIDSQRQEIAVEVVVPKASHKNHKRRKNKKRGK